MNYCDGGLGDAEILEQLITDVIQKLGIEQEIDEAITKEKENGKELEDGKLGFGMLFRSGISEFSYSNSRLGNIFEKRIVRIVESLLIGIRTDSEWIVNIEKGVSKKAKLKVEVSKGIPR